MTPTCIDACVICDIDGYVGINNSTQSGQEPPGFCTTTAHHMQWIAFIAGSTNLTITVTPSNCDGGEGLEVGIYQSLDCNTFQLVSNCDGAIEEGQVGVFTNTVSLIIGQYYYFVMDGNYDDVCQYIIHVTSGTTQVPPLAAVSAIQGTDTLCQAERETYSISPITGATSYIWTLNEVIVGNGISTDINFPGAGQYTLCASAYNVCDTAAPACQIITVLPSSASQDSVGLCEGNCLILTDTTICDPGIYTLHFTNTAGCDSVLILTVTEQSFLEVDVMTTICSTDSIQVGNIWYHPPGQYDIPLPGSSGCDSIVHLQLDAIVCEIDGLVNTLPVLCAGTSSGELILEVFTGTPPFAYSWQQAGNGLSGSGTIPDINTTISIQDLPSGAYAITVYDSFGNDRIMTASITEPPALTLSLEAKDYHGYSVSCAGQMDGQIIALPQGGTPDYNYTWSNGDTTVQLNGLSPQTYSLTVTDAAGCQIIEDILLIEPGPLLTDVLFIDPACEGPATGMIQVVSTVGGAPPFQYALSGGQSGNAGMFTSLPEGPYTLIITDANGCTTDTAGVLIAAIRPQVSVGDDIEIELGYSTYLSSSVNPVDAIIEWTPADNLSCVFCTDPLAMPFVTTVYAFTATSADGCEAADSLKVTVRKSEDAVYIPNAFSPNGDGINDYFTVFGNRSVKEIEKLTIFSRWGELVFEDAGFMPNDHMTGWDGSFRNKIMQPAVYTWRAEIRYIDDEILVYSGDLTLVR